MSINFLYNSENVQEDSLLPLTLPPISTPQPPPSNLFITPQSPSPVSISNFINSQSLSPISITNSILDSQNESSSLLTFSPLHSFTLNPICPTAKKIYKNKVKNKNLIKFIYCDKGKKVKKLKI